MDGLQFKSNYRSNLDDWRVVTAYAALVTIAALNRETAYLLVALWWGWHMLICGRWRDARVWGTTAFFTALYLSIVVGLRLWRGDAPVWWGMTPDLLLQRNLRTLPEALLNNAPVLILVGAAGIADQHWRRILIFAVALYIPFALVFGGWVEIGLWLPLLPLLLVGLCNLEWKELSHDERNW